MRNLILAAMLFAAAFALATPAYAGAPGAEDPCEGTPMSDEAWEIYYKAGCEKPKAPPVKATPAPPKIKKGKKVEVDIPEDTPFKPVATPLGDAYVPQAYNQFPYKSDQEGCNMGLEDCYSAYEYSLKEGADLRTVREGYPSLLKVVKKGNKSPMFEIQWNYYKENRGYHNGHFVPVGPNWIFKKGELSGVLSGLEVHLYKNPFVQGGIGVFPNDKGVRQFFISHNDALWNTFISDTFGIAPIVHTQKYGIATRFAYCEDQEGV